MNDQRLRLLIAIVAVLGVLRFVVVPWTRAQAEAHDRLVVLTQQLDRSIGVVQNRDGIEKAHKTLSAEMSTLRARFPVAADAQQFRLAAQRGIEQLTRTAGMELKVFDWILEGRLPEAGLAYGRVKLNLSGTLANAARWQAEVEGSLPQAVIRESQLSLRSPSPATPDMPADLAITADLFYRVAAP